MEAYMSAPYWSPNHSICPDCGGSASDKQRPESGWFVCQCGNEWSINENRRLKTGTPEETGPQTQAIGTARLVGSSDKPISKRLGEI